MSRSVAERMFHAAALSDGANALDLKWLRPVLQELQAVHTAVTAARSNAV